MESFLRICALLLGRLRRRLAPLAALTLAACLLAATAGQVLDAAWSEGGDLHLNLVLTSESSAGMGTVEMMSDYLSAMRDVAGYCTFQPAQKEEADRLLRAGEATAVIVLPDGFLEDVMSGQNTPPTLLTSPGRPLESWLAGWLGASAADLLTSAQAGIYAVLDLYDTLPAPTIERGDVVWGINLKYIQSVLDRGSLYQYDTVQPTGALSVADHYTMGTLIALLLLLTPCFAPIYGGEGFEPFLRRLRAVGVSDALPPTLALLVSFLLCWLLFWLPVGVLLIATGGTFLSAAGPAALCALVAAGFGGVCCTMCNTHTGASLLAFLVIGLNALVAGCLIPPALLPAPLRMLGTFSPLAWMRSALATPLGYDPTPIWPLLLAGVVLCCVTVLFAVVRRRQEV